MAVTKADLPTVGVLESHFDDVNSVKDNFKKYDADNSGSIDKDEVMAIMKALGQRVSAYEVNNMIKEVDVDNSGTVDYQEFLFMLVSQKDGKTSALAKTYTKVDKLNVVKGKGGASHSFSDEERYAFADMINSELADDKDIAHLLPLSTENDDLFTKTQDGLLYAKLINWAAEGTIDFRVLNTGKMSVFQVTENLNLVVESAKGLGLSIQNIGAEDLKSGTIHLVLGILWQIIKLGILASISLKNHPNLARLLEEDEELADLLKLSPEEILVRWVNYQLNEAGSTRRIRGFGNDIKDGEVYTLLLQQISAGVCSQAPLNESDPLERAELVLVEADKLQCRKFVRAGDIASGNRKLNLAFVANLFNHYPALDPVEGLNLDDLFDDENDAREERAYRCWLNSLGVDPEVRNLFDDLRDGLVLLQVEDRIQKDVVDWKVVSKTFKGPAGRFKKLENCNQVIKIGKQFGFSLVGIGGEDIAEGNKKLTLALVFQAFKKFIMEYLAGLNKGSKTVTDADLLNFCNEKAGTENSKFGKFTPSDWMTICSQLRASAVNMDLLTNGDSEEDIKDDAKLAITTMRKIGASVFVLWEDIANNGEKKNEKLLLTVAGALYGAALKMRK